MKMNKKIFIDTNIWIYAHLAKNNQQSDVKLDKAVRLLESLSRPVISTQVLNEYYRVMLKYKIPDKIIQENIHAIIDASEVILITLSVIQLAHKIRIKYQFSYFDCLMLAAALDIKCELFYSEDLQHNQIIEELRIVNPLL